MAESARTAHTIAHAIIDALDRTLSCSRTPA